MFRLMRLKVRLEAAPLPIDTSLVEARVRSLSIYPVRHIQLTASEIVQKAPLHASSRPYYSLLACSP